jgi:hypothetical protein
LLVFVKPVGGEAHLGNGVHPDTREGRGVKLIKEEQI